MTDSPPFDPPYISVETTAQGVRVIETSADGSRRERSASPGEVAGLKPGISSGATEASIATPGIPKKKARSLAGMPPGSILLAVPFAEKDAAKRLGARWNADRRSWYVPAGIDASLFSRWRKDEADS